MNKRRKQKKTTEQEKHKQRKKNKKGGNRKDKNGNYPSKTLTRSEEISRAQRDDQAETSEHINNR